MLENAGVARGSVAGKLDYSNVHYTLIGKVIEQVSGMDWRDYLAQGSKVVTVGFLRRKMRMDRKNGYALIMTKPTQPTRKTRVHVG